MRYQHCLFNPKSPVESVSLSPIVLMLRPGPREVSHLPQVAQPVTPHPPSRSSGFRPVAANYGRLTHPPRENLNQTWLRPGAFGQCLDPRGWMGEEGQLCPVLGWIRPHPGSAGEGSGLAWNVRQTKDSTWCQEFYWLSNLSESRRSPQVPVVEPGEFGWMGAC